jgi:hypothetical protein
VHPVIEEINRARGEVRPDVLRRWQQRLRDDVQPQLDELDALKAPIPAKSKKESA